MSKKPTNKKQKQKDCLGRFLIKDRFKKQHFNNSSRHTTEMDDGQNYHKIDFKSITEQTEVEDFLASAELAGNTFKVDRLNGKIVVPISNRGVLSAEERNKIHNIQIENKEQLRIPRRPPWDRSMDVEELNESEKSMFRDWRRSLALLQEVEGITLTPYERNLEFWRQLWRVIERSDVVVQIVDARNPLLFRCEDLVSYVKDVDQNKENLLLVNKADFLTDEQRAIWASYFKEANIKAIFYSATAENLDKIEEEDERELSSILSPQKDKECNLNHLRIDDDEGEEIVEDEEVEEIEDEKMEEDDEEEEKTDLTHTNVIENPTQEALNLPPTISNSIEQNLNTNILDTNSIPMDLISSDYINSSKLLTREELVEALTHFYKGPKLNLNYVTIGLVGYPNVGKSSTINSLLQEKKVSVSATPGKTKHFQTLFLSDEVMLCDCPGLVFPAFVSSKEEMILSGILPIDEMRQHVPPMNLLLSLIPRDILEKTYGVRIPPAKEGEDPNRCPTSEEFITAYGYHRGYMTQRGIPDHPRSARYVLKDYINGKLVYCHSPPDVPQESFHDFRISKEKKILSYQTPQQSNLVNDGRAESLDHDTGEEMNPKVVVLSARDEKFVDKPWRLQQKLKRNSKQKRRIKFSHLDQ